MCVIFVTLYFFNALVYDALFELFPDYFLLMRPNEFAATRFVNAYWRNTFHTRLNKPKFRPEISILTSVGFGDVSDKFRQTVNTYNKGYYESGIFFGNLYKYQFFNIGIGIHYRYGSYRMPKEIDNWGLMLGLRYGL